LKTGSALQVPICLVVTDALPSAQQGDALESNFGYQAGSIGGVYPFAISVCLFEAEGGLPTGGIPKTKDLYAHDMCNTVVAEITVPTVGGNREFGPVQNTDRLSTG